MGQMQLNFEKEPRQPWPTKWFSQMKSYIASCIRTMFHATSSLSALSQGRLAFLHVTLNLFQGLCICSSSVLCGEMDPETSSG